ncbi:cholesterol 7-desaturase nvd-like [Liolophura sinensis]|uniref:cholesterol 7-desaturase nvd-like n=1 Tax=Liolophura sinensis TaxID=3198878 RepID=UPI0031592189
MAADKRSVFWIFVSVVCVVVVSAAVTEKLLHVPMFEVGSIWFRLTHLADDLNGNLFSRLSDISLLCATVYLASVIGGFFLLREAYRLFFVPLNRVRLQEDVGYLPDGRFSNRDLANMVQKRRMVGEIPPVYPNGWFGLIESHRLNKSEAINIGLLGLNLAVFRDDNGEAHAIDAYCPHMGANLAAGGRVVGDCLECPFHGWQFRGADGKCTKIPYTDSIPDIAKVKSWPVTELNGWIYLWHHAEGLDPTWKIPEIEEIQNGEWKFRGRSEHHINAHIEEIPENGADVYHLGQVHGPIMMAGIDLRFMYSKLWEFAKHEWTACWEALPAPNAHIGQIKLTHSIKMFGKRLPPVDLSVDGQQIGPGIVYLKFDNLLGKGAFLQSLTPEGPMMQRLVHNIYVHWKMPIIIAKFFMLGEALQVERDIMIWNNKCYEAKPLFVKSKEDTLIARHRRWYQQFYSENSPRFKFQKETLEW